MAKKIKKVLIDANVFIALNWPKDSCHIQAKKILKNIEKKYQLLTNNYLVAETLTVLLLKTKDVEKTSILANGFYYHSEPFKMLQAPKSLQFKTLKIFSKQQKPLLSFADCTLIAQAIDQNIKTIFTFDKNIKSSPFLKRGYKFLG